MPGELRRLHISHAAVPIAFSRSQPLPPTRTYTEDKGRVIPAMGHYLLRTVVAPVSSPVVVFVRAASVCLPSEGRPIHFQDGTRQLCALPTCTLLQAPTLLVEEKASAGGARPSNACLALVGSGFVSHDAHVDLRRRGAGLTLAHVTNANSRLHHPAVDRHHESEHGCGKQQHHCNGVREG